MVTNGWLMMRVDFAVGSGGAGGFAGVSGVLSALQSGRWRWRLCRRERGCVDVAVGRAALAALQA